MNSIYMYFKQITETFPDEEAVKDENNRYTYADIFNGVKLFQQVLYKYDVKRNDRVMIHLSKSVKFLVAVISLLSIGACYVPIDCFLNKNRKEYIYHKSGATAIITNENIDFKFEGNVIYLDETLKTMLETKRSSQNTDFDLQDDMRESIAYIMFTSGTTGTPKGVIVQQKGLINLLQSGISEIGFKRGRSILFLSNVSFDMSIPESVLALCMGVRVIIIPEKQRQNYRYIARRIAEEKVSILHMTPRRLEHTLLVGGVSKVLQTVKTIILGAEKTDERFLEEIKKHTKACIYNFYGPTEATVFSTISNLTNKTQVDIGEPIDNAKIYLLDAEGKEVEDGEVGEIAIGGVGVSLGYINNIEETNKKFVINNNLGPLKIYMSGDFALKNEEGALVLKGRKDNQVKFRGYRIELEELETMFSKMVGIRECIACPLLHKNTETMFICYTVSCSIDKQKLKEFADLHIPYYIAPYILVEVMEFPLNHNGKIDRRKFKECLSKALRGGAF